MSPRIEFDRDELRPLIQLAVDEAIERMREERLSDHAGRVLLNKREAAEALVVSQSTLDRLRREAGLPSVKLDGLVLFRPEALQQWAAEKEGS
jgi:excisionase family DNA binding protein